MIEYGTNQGIYYAIREGYVSGARVKELHCRRRYGTYNQFAVNVGALRYPLCSRKKEKKFVNTRMEVTSRSSYTRTHSRRQTPRAVMAFIMNGKAVIKRL